MPVIAPAATWACSGTTPAQSMPTNTPSRHLTSLTRTLPPPMDAHDYRSNVSLVQIRCNRLETALRALYDWRMSRRVLVLGRTAACLSLGAGPAAAQNLTVAAASDLQSAL